MSQDALLTQIRDIGRHAQLKQLAVAFDDFALSAQWGCDAERLFHAASTFKAALLLALLKAAADGPLRLEGQLQIRNRFLSVIDGAPYRIDRDRDGDAEVHRRLGRSMSLRALANAMITRSSNLATNLLLDFLTPAFVCRILVDANVPGVFIRRGVEDLAAHEQGLNNEASANGLAALFRVFARPGFLPEPLRQEGLEILLAQEFNRMIPAKLPGDVKVAHKTGEISTHAHDAGIVFPLNRAPYVLAILTESEPNQHDRRQRAVAEISAAIYRHITEAAP